MPTNTVKPVRGLLQKTGLLMTEHLLMHAHFYKFVTLHLRPYETKVCWNHIVIGFFVYYFLTQNQFSRHDKPFCKQQ